MRQVSSSQGNDMPRKSGNTFTGSIKALPKTRGKAKKDPETGMLMPPPIPRPKDFITQDDAKAASKSLKNFHAKYRTPNVDTGCLSMRQLEFCVLVGEQNLEPELAARSLGIPNPKIQASNYMRNPKIRHLIAEKKALYANAADITRRKVVDGLMEAINLGKVKGEPAAMVAGWREIGKLCGLYEPQKRELKLSVQGEQAVKRLQTLSDDELIRMVEEDTAILEGEFHNVVEKDESADSSNENDDENHE